MKNKKGVEINITTIIILVLAILVLVILGLFFSGTLRDLWYKILNIESVHDKDALAMAKDNCEKAYSVEQFCLDKITLKNKKTGADEQYYCYNLPDGYNAVYTITNPDGTTIKLRNEGNCDDQGYPRSS